MGSQDGVRLAFVESAVNFNQPKPDAKWHFHGKTGRFTQLPHAEDWRGIGSGLHLLNLPSISINQNQTPNGIFTAEQAVSPNFGMPKISVTCRKTTTHFDRLKSIRKNSARSIKTTHTRRV